MKQISRLLVIAAVLVIGVSAFASPFAITSVSVSESYPATVTWDSTHIYVNWQGLPFSTSDFVNITINGGVGNTGAQGFVEYDFPCLGCLYGNTGGPFAFTNPTTVFTESDPGFPFVQNDFVASGINISYLWSSGWTGAAFNGEVFTFTGSAVPEPGTLVLLGSGALGLAGFVRRKLKL
jgi:hypothetical protein